MTSNSGSLLPLLSHCPVSLPVINPHWHTNPRSFFQVGSELTGAIFFSLSSKFFAKFVALQPSNVCSASPCSSRWPDVAPNSPGWQLWPSSSAGCRAVCRELEQPHSQACCVMCGWCKGAAWCNAKSAFWLDRRMGLRNGHCAEPCVSRPRRGCVLHVCLSG
jgi:hypothetical protein